MNPVISVQIAVPEPGEIMPNSDPRDQESMPDLRSHKDHCMCHDCMEYRKQREVDDQIDSYDWELIRKVFGR